MKKKYIDVIAAKYLHDYTLEISFSDKEVRVVDFYPFLSKKSNHPDVREYLKLEKFKTYRIEYGRLIWGENDELIFPLEMLYAGKIPA